MDKKQEFELKHSRMREYIKKKNVDALLFQRTDTFAWASCGGSDHVNTATDLGVAALLVTPDRCTLVSNRIEENRLKEEEIAGLPIETDAIPWAENRDAHLLDNIIGSKRTLTDSPLGYLPPLPDDFVDLMMALTESEIERFKSAGADTGAAVEAAAREVSPGMTEFDAAGLLAAQCYKRGLTPIVALIASDERLKKFRHPLPTSNPIKKTVMLVVCGRRNGLIASATRIVSFGSVDSGLKRRHEACARVDSVFNSATRPGINYADVFRNGIKTYSDEGFEGEWLLHHQGGPAGYRTRYFTANEKSAGTVVVNSAHAWNPSITGTKIEDTIIVLEKENLFLTQTGNWPYVKVDLEGQIFLRPDILVV
jgi:Xaa-Pro dipeptidase